MNPIALADLHWDTKEIIDAGCFGGEVYKTTWSYNDEDGDPMEDTVAVVDLKDAARDQIFAERDRRISLCYKKVVELLGWCQVSNLQHPLLVYEHSDDGDLWSYLHRFSGDELTFDVMKKMAYDIARGMNYLHGQNIVHGDLAARNCIVYKPENVENILEWEVKVGDNAYYNLNFQGCYYNEIKDPVRCPVRWMPPENLPFRFLDGKMVPSDHGKSRKGDVWAFGVVLFEIWTGGEFPFGGVADKEVCRRVLGGWRATDCSSLALREEMDTIWRTMRSCWQTLPKRRPTFANITRSFEEREECESSSDEAEQSDYENQGQYYYYE